MRIVQINATAEIGSTGKICSAISNILEKQQIDNYILYAGKKNNKSNAISYMSMLEVKMNAFFSKLFGNYGFNSKIATKKLIKHIRKLNPSILHLHNIHGHNCDLQMLFQFIKKEKIKVVWTFHDCWAFTGYCPYFDLVECTKWKIECSECAQFRKFSYFFDRSNQMFKRKKKLLLDIDMTIVTPSKWLSNLIGESFLKKYPVYVINNGINVSIYKKYSEDFRKQYYCEEKFLILGVAYDWSERKGLDVFIKLANELPSEYQIVLVGINEQIKNKLPKNIIAIPKTRNQIELAKIYSAANVFINPTREENYPTVNMEALACGTPVVTFDTGGSAEMLSQKNGIVVQKNDIEKLIETIKKIKVEKIFVNNTELIDVNDFDEKKCYERYLLLYKYLQNENKKGDM